MCIYIYIYIYIHAYIHIFAPCRARAPTKDARYFCRTWAGSHAQAIRSDADSALAAAHYLISRNGRRSNHHWPCANVGP